ncbi:hypothetical protein CYMTET_3161 [Cymbomonas tetramitiformis]|uniref:Nucleotide-diphospho-sugar transferase domain-containing protein n=1 Tax=Cymbomonas tetramitiformis TaxID=36881 RepID=A0AAE0LLD2_9CHLO|nr:hypothetical protein CYMTET_3161 [Cymbomonas tetramitiformis]
MKGTKEKDDLLVAKSQTPEQDGLAYVKSCRRRESALNAGKKVEDSIVRQDIEECVKGLRIKEYKERVSEQLRVSHPAPNKVYDWALEKVGQDHVVHFDMIDESDDVAGDAHRWRTKNYVKLVSQRAMILKRIVEMGIDVLYADTDITWCGKIRLSNE